MARLQAAAVVLAYASCSRCQRGTDPAVPAPLSTSSCLQHLADPAQPDRFNGLLLDLPLPNADRLDTDIADGAQEPGAEDGEAHATGGLLEGIAQPVIVPPSAAPCPRFMAKSQICISSRTNQW